MARSRAVLLPTPGDPFLLRHWLSNFRTYAHLVDELLVGVSWRVEPAVHHVIKRDIEAVGGRLIYTGRHLDHGQNLEVLRREMTSEHVLLMEDDLYVREPSEIDRVFTRIEQGEVRVVGSPRGSMGGELLRACSKKWGTQQAALWPHLLFFSAEDFRSLDVFLGAVGWEPGELVRGLDYTVTEPNQSADTFGAASFLLRGRGLSIEALTDYGDHYAVTDRVQGGPWFHIGSLSTGPYIEEHNREDRDRNIRENAWSWERRVSWWERCIRTWPGGLNAQAGDYANAVAGLKALTGHDKVDARTAHYDTLVNWEERP